jgi:5-methylcytosine-specific restriction endonuclease McrA
LAENLGKRQSKPGVIHLRIVEVMKRFPEGISGGQMRQELDREGLRPEEQTHLDRRKRDLKKWFIIYKTITTVAVNGKKRRVTLYRYGGQRERISDEGQLSLRARAEIIHGAHGRCQMCGRTIEKDGIKLVVDHKKPRDWGGGNDRAGASPSGDLQEFAAIHVQSQLITPMAKSSLRRTNICMF